MNEKLDTSRVHRDLMSENLNFFKNFSATIKRKFRGNVKKILRLV